MTRFPHRALALPILVSLVLACAASVSAQQVGRLVGRVKDVDGIAIKGATVKAVRPEAMPAEFMVTSDEKGRWGMLGLQAGEWLVSFEAPGYESAKVNLRVSVLRTNPDVDVTLVGAAARGALDGVDAKLLQADLDAASALMIDQKWDEAIVAYKAILTTAPALTMTNMAIGSACRGKKDYDGAIAAYQEILKSHPDHQKALLELGRTAREKGDTAAAVQYLEKAVSVDAGSDLAGEARTILAQIKTQ